MGGARWARLRLMYNKDEQKNINFYVDSDRCFAGAVRMSKLFVPIIAFAVGILNLFGCKAQNQQLMGHGEKVLVIGRHADMLLCIFSSLLKHPVKRIAVFQNKSLVAGNGA
jgi:hypothetical protein